MKRLALLLTLVMVSAGCLSSGSEPETGSDDPTLPTAPERPVMPEDPMPEGAGHNHADEAQHKFLWNYDFSDRDPIMMNQANAAGIHALVQRDEYLFGAVYGSHSVAVDGGVYIWGLQDPAHPELLGRWIIHGSVGGDRSIGATEDGNYVVISTEPVTCFSQASANPLTVYLLDVRDKRNPIVADAITVSGHSLGHTGAPRPNTGAHSVFVHRIDDVDYAFLSGIIYEIDLTEQGARLVPTGSSIQAGHDMYVRDTPWNTTWTIAAGGGLRVYNVTDPFQPTLIGEWNVPNGYWFSDESYYIHTADIAFLGDTDILAVTTEDWQDHASMMFVLDATPLRNSTDGTIVLDMLGHWHNPGNHTAAGLGFSLHNPRMAPDGIISISSYHGGLWQLDLRYPEFWAEPAEIGYAVYADSPPPVVMDPVQGADACQLGYSLQAPTYMDVALGPDGILYAADVYTGLYTFTPTMDHPIYGNATA